MNYVSKFCKHFIKILSQASLFISLPTAGSFSSTDGSDTGSSPAPYTIVAKDRYGCATHRQKSTCANDRTIAREAIEQRVPDGLRERLLTPELFAEFSRGFHEEINRAAREREASRLQAKQQLVEVERKIAGIIKAIEDGM